MSIKKRIIIIIALLIIMSLIITLGNKLETKISKNTKYSSSISSYEPFKKTSNYKLENKDRYVSFYENNRNLDYETIVTFVNIGLDKGFYNYIKAAKTKKGKTP